MQPPETWRLTAGGKGMRGRFMEGMFATLLATLYRAVSPAPPLRFALVAPVFAAVDDLLPRWGWE